MGGEPKQLTALNTAYTNMTATKERLGKVSKIAYQRPLRGKYQSVSDNRFKSESGTLIEIQRFYSDKPTSARYSIIRISPNGERERLSGLFATSNPLAYSFDIKHGVDRQYYIIEFDKYYKTCEVRLS
jgi:hypothetical protein